MYLAEPQGKRGRRVVLAPIRQRYRRQVSKPDTETLTHLDISYWIAFGTVCVICLAYILIFCRLSLLKYDTYQLHAEDLSNVSQAVWTTAHGRLLEFTNCNVLANNCLGKVSRFAFHVEPILILISPLYLLWDTPKVLLILQTIVVGLGALPVFWLARLRLQQNGAPILFSLMYLMFPSLQAANLDDFHAVTLTTSLLLFAFYFLVTRRDIWLFVFAALAMSCKEEIPLVIVMFGLYALFIQRRTRFGIALTLLAFAWFEIDTKLVIPNFNPLGRSPLLDRYGNIGGGNPEGIVATLVRSPSLLKERLLIPAKFTYLYLIFSPTGYLPLLSPWTLALAAPSLAVNLLSTDPIMYSGGAHYTAEIVPMLIISAIEGVALVGMLFQRWLPKAIFWIVLLLSSFGFLCGLQQQWERGYSPFSSGFVWPVVTEHHRLAQKFIEMILPGAAVSAQSQLNPHVSGRFKLYLFPDIRDADYIFLDSSSKEVYPTDLTDIRVRVRKILDDGTYGVLASEDGYLLLKRGLSNPNFSTSLYSFTQPPDQRIDHPLVITFGGRIQLVGYSISPRDGAVYPNQPIHLQMFWKILAPVDKNYTIVLFVTKPDGALTFHYAVFPATTWNPTSQWTPGEIVMVDSGDLDVVQRDPGQIDLDLAVQNPDYDPSVNTGRLVPEVVQAGEYLEVVDSETLVVLRKIQVRKLYW